MPQANILPGLYNRICVYIIADFVIGTWNLFIDDSGFTFFFFFKENMVYAITHKDSMRIDAT